ncbi:chorismate synthase [Candidatus Odyssella acanthamoebae]|uniref:Chorismate synthase n=1 Tax=Candidatus Odyssella acanthamoebae TaxID=91604 RepID=A0A077AUF6_9PROT|nr:chorismate synthase [Candidatus Paracaedibacter acanthamoebae]AIK95996.1 chorismate synthase [Candidatus Paracaedibacter acanthamoebae]
MPGNTIGQAFTLTTWGESHGTAIGGVLDGVPPGFPLDIKKIQQALDRRKPGGHHRLTSARQESDQIHILSGVYEGKTLGTPLSFLIYNTDQRSGDYDPFKNIYRPGHADYSYTMKYGHVDHRGGGRASARETAIRVAAGAIAHQILQLSFPTLQTTAAVIQLGTQKLSSTWLGHPYPENPLFCPDEKSTQSWTPYLQDIKNQGRSVGALIEVHVKNMPSGLGEPVYDKLDADLAKALMSINAVKGVEIGEGFGCVTSENGYDELSAETASKHLTNKAGGIVGGISTGQDIICRVALKPTSSTPQSRKTLTKDEIPVDVSITGRHDPCVGIRAVPIVEAMVSLVIMDHFLRWQGQCGSKFRK